MKLVLPLFCLVLAGRLAAQIIIPVSNNSDSGTGSLRQALVSAASVPLNEEVIIDLAALQASFPDNSVQIQLTSGLLLVTRPLSIVASPDYPKVTISRHASLISRLMFIEGGINGTVRLSNLEFRGGQTFQASPEGGAIFYEQFIGSAVELIVEDCVFFGNDAGGADGGSPDLAQGGAIYFSGNPEQTPAASLVIRDSEFSANVASGVVGADGGAIYAEFSEIELADSRFSNNRNIRGAFWQSAPVDLRATAGVTRISRCYFVNNNSTQAGTGGQSALWVTKSSLATPEPQIILTDCTFSANGDVTTSGPAMAITGNGGNVPALMENCTFDGNKGAVNSAFTITNCDLTCRHLTVTRNRHNDDDGHAISAGPSCDILLSRSVVAGNLRQFGGVQSPISSPDFASSAGIISQGYNFIGSATGQETTFVEPGDQAGTNAAPLDPQLASLGDYGGPVETAPPMPESPLVDALPEGSPATVANDARGTLRPQGLRIDLGAVELPRLTYAAWDNQIPELKDRGERVDVDGDGLSNGQEYFFGTDPNSFTSNPLRMLDGGTLLEYVRSTTINPAFFSNRLIEQSDTLAAPWVPADLEFTVTPAIPGQIELLRYRAGIFPSSPARFYRHRLVE